MKTFCHLNTSKVYLLAFTEAIRQTLSEGKYPNGKKFLHQMAKFVHITEMKIEIPHQ